MALSLIVALSYFTAHIAESQQECTDFNICNGQDINDVDGISCSGRSSCESTTIQSNDYINCTAFQSCRRSTTKAKGNVYCNGGSSCQRSRIRGRIVQCSGKESCEKSRSIVAKTLLYCGGERSCIETDNIKVGKRLYCNGMRSCAHLDRRPDPAVPQQIKIGEIMYCGAQQSCRGVTVNPIDVNTDTTLYCSGVLSCSRRSKIYNIDTVYLNGESSGKDADFYGCKWIYAYGKRSLGAATVDSDGITEMNVFLYGAEAGKSGQPATIICRSGATCNLLCKGQACAGVQYKCLPGSTCKINPQKCKNSGGADVNGIACPTVTNSLQLLSAIETEMDDQKLVDSKMEDYEYGNGIIDLDELEHMEIESEITITGDVQSCDAANECEGQTLGTTDGDVECNGFESCYQSISNAATSTYCYGEESCGMSQFNDANEIICDGLRSCVDSEYDSINTGTFSCNGKDSCLNLAAKNGQQTAKGFGCYGTGSCKNLEATIDDPSRYDYFRCYGNRACQDSKIIATTGTSCEAQYACKDMEILATTGGDIITANVGCSSKNACFGAVIDTDNTVWGAAEQSLTHATISAKQVTGSGYMSLIYATIDSKDKPVVTVKAYGHLAGFKATFICRDGSRCTLECKTSGCDSMNFVCLGNAKCNVEPIGCDIARWVDDVVCPNMLTSIPEVTDHENDEIYQYLQREMEQDMELYDLLDNYMDSDIIEEYLISDSIQKKEQKLLLLSSHEINMIQHDGIYDAKMLFGIGSVIFIIGSLLSLWYIMKYYGKRGEYQEL